MQRIGKATSPPVNPSFARHTPGTAVWSWLSGSPELSSVPVSHCQERCIFRKIRGMGMDLKRFERLAGSMLLQAMADLKSGSCKHRGLAFEWLDGQRDDNLSFLHCCRMLGRDPQQVRGAILRGLSPDYLHPKTSSPLGPSSADALR